MAPILHHLPSLGKRPMIMGILNVTPDSFSDGGALDGAPAAIARAQAMFAEGADIIDIGGESTRPGARPVSAVEERRRVLPVIEGLVAAGAGPISIDTTKAEVAAASVEAGAVIVNDISGGTFDPQMRAVVAERRCGFVIMHTRERPEIMQSGAWRYEGGVLGAVATRLAELATAAIDAGITKGQIVLDPGIGFGKTLDENLDLLAGLPALRAIGYPLLVGTSRKSFLGALTGRAVGARLPATAASVALCVTSGADIVRVHDVAAMRDAALVAAAIAARNPG